MRQLKVWRLSQVRTVRAQGFGRVCARKDLAGCEGNGFTSRCVWGHMGRGRAVLSCKGAAAVAAGAWHHAAERTCQGVYVCKNWTFQCEWCGCCVSTCRFCVSTWCGSCVCVCVCACGPLKLEKGMQAWLKHAARDGCLPLGSRWCVCYRCHD